MSANLTKKIICKELVEINGFRIKYVQPDPLPQAIAFLQQCNLQGLDFVKIPISEKEDRLYLMDAILTLLTRCGVEISFARALIKGYNNNDSSAKEPLLGLFILARYYAEKNDFEFLV
jgi:hypothetical protein